MMDNFANAKAALMFPSLVEQRLNTTYRSDTGLDLIVAADIGRVAAEAFLAPERFNRREIDLAAESLTMAEVAETLSDVTGRRIIPTISVPKKLCRQVRIPMSSTPNNGQTRKGTT